MLDSQTNSVFKTLQAYLRCTEIYGKVAYYFSFEGLTGGCSDEVWKRRCQLHHDGYKHMPNVLFNSIICRLRFAEADKDCSCNDDM